MLDLIVTAILATIIFTIIGSTLTYIFDLYFKAIQQEDSEEKQ